MGYERVKRFPWIAAVLVAASIALTACAPGSATGSNNATPEDGRPSANQPAAPDNGNGSDDGAGGDGEDDGTDAGDDGRDDRDDFEDFDDDSGDDDLDEYDDD